MGKKLASYYDEASSIGGLSARIRLAQLTKMPSSEADFAPDVPRTVEAFQAALVTLRKEWAARPQASPDGASAAPRLDEGYRSIQALFSRAGVTPADALRKVTETVASSLDVERASVWLYDTERTTIRCADLFSRKSGDHSSGMELREQDFRPYFEALRSERTIAAHDAHLDPRTEAFSTPYLRPLGINSMLDVPIWTGGRMRGVICHEHTGPARSWTPAEEEFAYRVSGLVQRLLDSLD